MGAYKLVPPPCLLGDGLEVDGCAQAPQTPVCDHSSTTAAVVLIIAITVTPPTVSPSTTLWIDIVGEIVSGIISHCHQSHGHTRSTHDTDRTVYA